VLFTANNREIDEVFASLSEKRIDALLVGGSPVLYSLRQQLVSAAARHGIPAMYPSPAFAESGGLMTYGANDPDDFRLVGVYVGRVLKGEKPADLPVLRPTKFDFILNLKTARALGLEIPPTLRALADKIIE
jgi:putative ABC transport system substrate-binding protein